MRMSIQAFGGLVLWGSASRVGRASLSGTLRDVKCLLGERKCFHKPRENVKMPLGAHVAQNYSLEAVRSPCDLILTQERKGDFLSAQLALSL